MQYLYQLLQSDLLIPQMGGHFFFSPEKVTTCGSKQDQFEEPGICIYINGDYGDISLYILLPYSDPTYHLSTNKLILRVIMTTEICSIPFRSFLIL